MLNGGASISIEGKVGASVTLGKLKECLWNERCILVRFLTEETTP